MKQSLLLMFRVIVLVTATGCGLPSTSEASVSDDGAALLTSRLAAGESVEFGENTTISAERFDGASFRNVRVVIRDANGAINRELIAERAELRATKREAEMVLTLHQVRNVMGSSPFKINEITITRPLS